MHTICRQVLGRTSTTVLQDNGTMVLQDIGCHTLGPRTMVLQDIGCHTLGPRTMVLQKVMWYKSPTPPHHPSTHPHPHRSPSQPHARHHLTHMSLNIPPKTICTAGTAHIRWQEAGRMTKVHHQRAMLVTLCTSERCWSPSARQSDSWPLSACNNQPPHPLHTAALPATRS